MCRISKLSENLNKLFNEIADKESKECGFIKRERKLKGSSFLKTMVFGNISDTKISIDRLRQLLSEESINISKQGLDNRFSESAVKFLKNIYTQSINLFQLSLPINCEVLDQFNSVKLQDSSYITLPNSMQNDYKGYGSSYPGLESNTRSGVKIQLLYDYLNQKIDSISLKDGSSSDQGYKDYLDNIHAKDLFIADLGYFVPNSFKLMNSKGAYFISRYKADTNLYDPMTGEKINFSKYLKNKTEFEQDLILGKSCQLKVRVVGTKLEPDKTLARKRKANKLAKSKGYKVSDTNKLLLNWSIFITNIQSNKLSSNQIQIIYKVRWQIELLFKLYKSHIGITELKAKSKPYRILCELYSKLIILVIFHAITCCVKLTDFDQEISLTKAILDFKSRGRELLNLISKTVGALNKFVSNMIDSWSKFALKDKKRKKRPSTFQLLSSLNLSTLT